MQTLIQTRIKLTLFCLSDWGIQKYEALCKDGNIYIGYQLLLYINYFMYAKEFISRNMLFVHILHFFVVDSGKYSFVYKRYITLRIIQD